MIERVLDINKDAVMIIKSTIPVVIRKKLARNIKRKILSFHQNFYRGKLYDNLYPSRIIVGEKRTRLDQGLLIEGAKERYTRIIDKFNGSRSN